ncbi:MAG: dihydrofolate reductase family protein [Methanomassiliicoccus sp.]|nr:dihydrofolate reductase family protein [Methanomassiliicoccus sp.]
MSENDRHVVLYLAVSLDGHVARRDGSVDWLPTEGPEDHGYAQFLSTVDTVVMGRTTYEQLLTFGPYPYRGMEGYVFTSRRRGQDANVRFVSGAVKTFASELRSAPGKDIWLVGGARLAQSFLAAGEVDRVIITVVPRLLGEGIPLFGRGPERPLRLVSCETFSDGLVQLRYGVDDLTRALP